ncbi:MAG: oxidoreductase domain protein [Herbinix sp.]|jgi:predicted dehydrogenase|nr:oxidoreductase domain protein [Herbinix sp.]
MDEVRIGIIGIGNMGFAHAKCIGSGEIEGLKLTALCDLDEEKIDKVRKEFPDIPVFIDYKELLGSGLVDAIIIAVPHILHADIAIDAFDSGLHVLVEKPADIMTSKARAMNEAAEKSGKVFCIMFNQRTNPIFAKAREIVQSGQLGALKRLVWIITNWYRTQHYYDSGSWRATWSGEGGGVLLNQAPHNLDLMQWIFGMPIKIRAFCSVAKYHDIEVEDDATIYAEYKNGATGVFITSTGECPGTNRLEISGDLGKLVLEDGKLKWWKLNQPEREFCFNVKEGFYEPSTEYCEFAAENQGTAHKGILQNFSDAILKHEELLAPGYDGINELQISNAAYLSSFQDRWVELPVCEKEFEECLKQLAINSGGSQMFTSHSMSSGYNERWQVRW